MNKLNSNGLFIVKRVLKDTLIAIFFLFILTFLVSGILYVNLSVKVATMLLCLFFIFLYFSLLKAIIKENIFLNKLILSIEFNESDIVLNYSTMITGSKRLYVIKNKFLLLSKYDLGKNKFDVEEVCILIDKSTKKEFYLVKDHFDDYIQINEKLGCVSPPRYL